MRRFAWSQTKHARLLSAVVVAAVWMVVGAAHVHGAVGGAYDSDHALIPMRDVRVYDMNVCAPIPIGDESVRVIDDHEALSAVIRHDASRAYCLERLEAPAFDRYVLLGVGFDSGWCVDPPGLRHEVWLDDAHGEVVIAIDFVKTELTCRMLSWNQLWLLAERPPDGVEWSYRATFPPDGPR